MLVYALIAIVCSLFFLGISMFDFGDDIGLDVDDHGFKIFSFRTLMFFGMGFGSAGALARYGGLEAGPSGMLAVLSGAALAAFGLLVFHLMYGQQATSGFDADTLLGKRGEVTVRIPGPGEPGQVMTTDDHGRALYMTAFAVKPITHGAVVQVVGVSGSTVEVKQV